MATKKPRIQVTVSFEVRELLGEISHLTGKPVGSIVSEMLENGKDALEITGAMLLASNNIRDSAKQAVFNALVPAASKSAHKLVDIIDDSLGKISPNIHTYAHTLAARVCDSDIDLNKSSDDSLPPSINKGVRSMLQSEKDTKPNESKLLIFKAFDSSSDK